MCQIKRKVHAIIIWRTFRIQ